MFKSEKLLIKKLFYIFVCLLVVLIIVSIPRIYAYLSDADSATNKVTVGGSNIEIIEDFDPPLNLEPGVEFTKGISVKNNGPGDCYVRIKAVFANGDMEQYCVVDWNRTDWYYESSDGYYYYPAPLKEGEVTPSLFTKVKINDDVPVELINDFEILVYSESYQATGFDTYTDAWQKYHANKPVTVIPPTAED